MRDGRRSGRIAITRALVQAGLIALTSFSLLSCSSKPDASTVVMIIESSPTNLDPRVGIDAQSERIDELIFDALLTRDEHLNVQPGLAESWNIPDPLTYVFHLHSGVKFHDGRPLTARDVKWTFDSLVQGKIRSTKASTYRFVSHIDAPDDSTRARADCQFHLTPGALARESRSLDRGGGGDGPATPSAADSHARTASSSTATVPSSSATLRPTACRSSVPPAPSVYFFCVSSAALSPLLNASVDPMPQK